MNNKSQLRWLSPVRLLACAQRLLGLSGIVIIPLAVNYIQLDPLPLKEVYLQALAVLWLVVAVSSWSFGQPWQKLRTPYHVLVAVFIVWSALSLVWCVAWRSSFRDFMMTGAVIIYGRLMLTQCRQAKFRMMAVVCFVGVGVVLSVLALYQYYGYTLGVMNLYEVGSRQRVSVTIGHNNGVASQLLISAVWTLALLVTVKPRLLKYWLGLALGLQSFVLVALCLTRAVWLAYPLALVLFVALGLGWYRWGRVVRWGVLVGVVGVVMVAIIIGAYGRAGDMLRDPNFADTVVKRLATFRPEFLVKDTRARIAWIGLWMIRDNPLLGVGFGGFNREYPFWAAAFFEHYPDTVLFRTPFHTQRAHNEYLQTWIELGVVGLLLVWWWFGVHLKSMWAWMRKSLSQLKQQRWFALGGVSVLAGVSVDALFGFPLHVAPVALSVVVTGVLWLTSAGLVADRGTIPSPAGVWRWVIPLSAALVGGLLLIPSPLPPVSHDQANHNPIHPGIRERVFAPVYSQYLSACYQKRHSQGVYLMNAHRQRLMEDLPRYRDTMYLLRAWMRRAYRYHPNYGELLNNLADSEYYTGNMVHVMAESMRAQGNMQAYQNLIGDVYHLYREALALYQRTGLDYQYRTHNYFQGKIHRFLDEFEPGQYHLQHSNEQFRLALARYDEYVEARIELALNLADQHQYDQAWLHWAKLLKTPGPARTMALETIRHHVRDYLLAKNYDLVHQWTTFLFTHLPPVAVVKAIGDLYGRYAPTQDQLFFYDQWLAVLPGNHQPLIGVMRTRLWLQQSLDQWLAGNPSWYRSTSLHEEIQNFSVLGGLMLEYELEDSYQQTLTQLADKMCEQFHAQQINRAELLAAWKTPDRADVWEVYLKQLGLDDHLPDHEVETTIGHYLSGHGWPLFLY